ncbi:MAG: hypothetical protein AAF376_07140 [Pseudomonadota bacterium]
MSKHEAGSKDWWIETALIAAGGVALAVWLWEPPTQGAENAVSRVPEVTQQQGTLADLFANGCITASDLQNMREGRTLRPTCPPAGIPIR